jgi:hypothetical protein
MTMKRVYRVTMQLQESETVALARLAHSEHRDMQRQAHHIVYANLITLGLLPELSIESVTPPKGAIS